IRELHDTSADLTNLIRATEFAIIFLDLEGRLRLYTPPATQLFPLRPEDVGRELAELLPRESDPQLFDDLADAMLGSGPRDHELRLRDGRIMRRRVTSYQNEVGAASGFVITYVEVTQHVQLREQQLALQHRAELTTLVESVPNLMWACAVDGPCTYLSPQWLRYTGIPAEPQLGDGWLQQVHPDDRDSLMAAWMRSVRNTDVMRTRIRLRRHDGEYRWFENHAVPQLDASGKVEKWFGSSTDVHEVMLLQQRLEERDRFMQMIADSVNGMIGYWDRDQRNQFANRHYSEWFGMSAEQVRGKTLREVLGDAVYALNRPFAEAALRGEAQQFERTIKRADGTTGYLLAEYRPHLVDGTVRGFTATATDITRVQEARLISDHIFAISPTPTMIVGADGKLLRWNNAARELLGYDEEQMAALRLEQLIPAHLRERHQRFQLAYMANPTHRAMGNGKFFPLVRADGSEVDVEIDLGGITVAGHRAVLACVRKVAELSSVAQRQLDHAVRARSAFLAQMSHEIRTPLNAILGMAQLLELENPTVKQLDRLRRIEDASRLLLDIINDVLDISSLEAGGLVLNKEQFSLQQLVDRSLALISERIKLKQLQLRVDFQPGVPDQLVGDARRIEQVLVNLLTNAVKFTNEGAITVAVSCTFASDKRVVLRMEVRDTGIGIAPQDLAALFKPFRQLKQGHARTYGGTGLGLSICRELARLMKGDCGVESLLGVGSTFWFTAQVERACAVGLGASLPSVTTASELQQFPNKRALVVEDNDINREVICELLQGRFGLQVRAVADGHEALRVVEEEPFDIVLMDIQMPGLDGLETTRLMRSRFTQGQLPIYALSANVAANDVNECIASGMNGHLGKPLLVENLNEVLRELWGSASAAQ
ncbi:MAG TPA: PAS domain S-box protein, partial [Polyangiales bacterium]